MITLTTDSKRFRAHRQAMDTLARRTEARTLAVRVQADAVIAHAARFIQRDTQRAARAVLQAGNSAGLTQRALPDLRPSREGVRIGQSLRGAVRLSMRNVSIWDARVAKWASMEKLYRSTGRAHYAYFRKIIAEKRLAEKELRFHTRRLEAALREEKQFDERTDSFTGVAIGTYGVNEDLRVNVRAAMRRNTESAFVLRRGVVALRRNIQIETKVFGGSGRLTQTRGWSFVSLTMHEPHFRFVEQRTRIMARSVAYARRGTNARRVSKKVYEQAIARGTTWTNRRAA